MLERECSFLRQQVTVTNSFVYFFPFLTNCSDRRCLTGVDRTSKMCVCNLFSYTCMNLCKCKRVRVRVRVKKQATGRNSRSLVTVAALMKLLFIRLCIMTPCCCCCCLFECSYFCTPWARICQQILPSGRPSPAAGWSGSCNADAFPGKANRSM